MRILFIRHAEPDYQNDTITEKGKEESQLLANYLTRYQPKEVYCSPLGRAKDTAQYTLDALKMEAIYCDWLIELDKLLDINDSPDLQMAYPDCIKENGKYIKRVVWDILPSYLNSHPEYFDFHNWRNTLSSKYSNLNNVYDDKINNFDSLLNKYGYHRDGSFYKVVNPNKDTIFIFCHLGVICALLSHILEVSPYILWHYLGMAPTSITELVSEERQEGTALFRILRIGDISHLKESEPSFACRFCEVFTDDTRH